MIIATGNVNIDENKAAAENASAKVDTAGEKFKSTIDGKITTSSQAPFDDGVDHSDGDVWYVQDTDHNTTAMYTYDGSTWNQTKMTTSTMSVGQLSALTADLGTIDSGYIEGTTITGAYIEEQGANGTITLSPSGLDAESNGSYFKFVANDSSGYSQLRGGLNVDYINGQGSIQMDGRIETQTQSMTGGSVFACTSGALYFESGPDAGSGLIDIHAANVYGNISGSQISGGLSLDGAIYCTHLGTGTGIVACSSVEANYHGIFPTFVQSASFNKTSQLSVKKDIEDIDTKNALNQILSSNIMQYKYKNQDNTETPNVGPIIDDEHEIGSKQYNVSNLMLNKDNTALSLDNEIGLLMGAVQELSKRNSDLSLRIASLERKNLNE